MNNALHTIGNGLSYGGQLLHILINYTLILLTVAPFLLNGDRPAKLKQQGWIVNLVVITFLQIVVWFVPGGVGVSLIWCAMAGYLALHYWRAGFEDAEKRKRLAQIALIAALATIVYYAVAFPVITTVAHLIALLVGMILCLIVGYRGSRLTSSS